MSFIFSNIVIRPFKPSDRESVRLISCETSFAGFPRYQFFEDDEVLADFLTIYFTDYEPESCFVAEHRGKTIGYLTGTLDERGMMRVFNSRILPKLILKLIQRGFLVNKKSLRFLLESAKAFLQGNLHFPDLTEKYPAVLHINIDNAYRNQKIGGRLIEYYLNYLREHKVSGVHLATMSEKAKAFFMKSGFEPYVALKRTHMMYCLKHPTMVYILTQKLL